MHRRLVAVVAGLALTILGAPAPPAGALAAGACVITGTIVFTPSAKSLSCQCEEIGNSSQGTPLCKTRNFDRIGC